MPDSQVRKLAVSAVNRLQSAGFTAYFVGGCVRDCLLNMMPREYDIATSAMPCEVEAIFPGSETSGKSFAITRAPVGGIFFEIATFRMDHDYTDGRRPEKVSFTDPKTDAKRRDFTINAMFYDPLHDQLIDYAGGQEDLKSRIIRCVGDPGRRFAEDHLRMLRAVRLAGTLDFKLAPETAEAIQIHAEKLAEISAERIQGELTRILTESQKPGDSLVLMDQLRLLKVILPEVSAMKGQKQPPEFHPEGDVFAHTVVMLNMLKHPNHQLAYAVLFHDIGKPPTAVEAADRIRFNGHASQGAIMAGEIMRRLRFSSKDIEAIAYCVENHMRFMDVQKMKRSTLRRLVGAATFPLELELHRLDCAASNNDLANWNFLTDFLKQLANEPVLPERWISGLDIMKMGIPESSKVGILLANAYDIQLEGRVKSREELLNWLRKQIMEKS